jgi:hypothetical protein
LQGPANEDINKSEILDMVCAIRNSENTDKDNKEWPQSDACKLSFQHMTGMDFANAVMKQKEEKGGEDDT